MVQTKSSSKSAGRAEGATSHHPKNSGAPSEGSFASGEKKKGRGKNPDPKKALTSNLNVPGDSSSKKVQLTLVLHPVFFT